MKIDGRAIREKLAKSDDRKKVSLYLSESLYDRFKRACGKDVSASAVMEELMQAFIDSLKSKDDVK